jgi:hypothetical protein
VMATVGLWVPAERVGLAEFRVLRTWSDSRERTARSIGICASPPAAGPSASVTGSANGPASKHRSTKASKGRGDSNLIPDPGFRNK